MRRVTETSAGVYCCNTALAPFGPIASEKVGELLVRGVDRDLEILDVLALARSALTQRAISLDSFDAVVR